jgi:CheY-like chemotaxis protein
VLNKLSDPKNRALFHLMILILYSLCVLIYEYQFVDSGGYSADDKQKHYTGGQIIYTGSYFLFLVVSSWFILSQHQIALVKRLIWIPMSMFVILMLSFIVVTVIAFLKEGVDSTGVGHVEWADIVATLDGGYAPNVRSVLILVGLTPSLIPIDIVLQFIAGNKVTEEISDKEVANYIENVSEVTTSPDVLLIEDDLECSAVVLKFCKKLKLECRHVETVAQARSILNQYNDSLKLIISDIFVRVEDENNRETGLEFVVELEKEFPKASRDFIVILMSGFIEMAKDCEQADYILQKPWNAMELRDILKKHNIV